MSWLVQPTLASGKCRRAACWRAMLGLLCFCAAAAAVPAGEADQRVAAARARWEQSPHGEMLRRILPPTTTPAQLPAPQSRGARLTAQYCVQCHHLAPPAMHHAAKWPAIVERMLPRMAGRGNLGAVMQDLMAAVKVPSAEEAGVITAYLQRYAQQRIDTAALPEAGQKSRAWTSYVQACSQCHVAPDPQRHTRAAWPRVVVRMEHNMAWMNRVSGSQPDPREPQYRADEITAYLQRYARR